MPARAALNAKDEKQAEAAMTHEDDNNNLSASQDGLASPRSRHLAA